MIFYKAKRRVPPLVKWSLVLLLALIVLAGIGAGLLWASYHRYVTLPEKLQARVERMVDVNAEEGTPNAAVLDAPLESGSFQVVINRMPTMQTGSSPCNIWLENPLTNPCDVRVSLYLADTGEYLGGTHRVERGKHVDEVKLVRELAAGEYTVTATFEMLDGEQDPTGELSVTLDLLVRE